VLFSDKQPLDWGVTGKSIALLYGLGPVYFLILLFLEYSDDGGSGGVVGRVLRYLRGSYDRMMLRWYGVEKVNGQLCLNDGLAEAAVNEDIKTEEEFVKGDANLHMSAPVVMRDLWKIYPPSVGVLGGLLASFKWFICCCRPNRPNQEGNDERVLPRRAVRGLTAAVQKGETFGLLGSNGAGKTTTLGVLTGDIAPTSGEAYVGGHDITGVVPGGVAQARKNIGFCPQTDP
jgi:ABC-type multidrug transport system fused ATPase/permease subunit